MTKERKLAIQMWEEIKEQIPNWDPTCNIAMPLRYFKHTFCSGNGLDWLYDCWFCQYMRGDCCKCPLKSCDHHNFATAWARIVDESSSLGTRLEACDEIIATLKGGSKCLK